MLGMCEYVANATLGFISTTQSQKLGKTYFSRWKRSILGSGNDWSPTQNHAIACISVDSLPIRIRNRRYLIFRENTKCFLQENASRNVTGLMLAMLLWYQYYDDASKWKHFPLYWPFVRGIDRSPVKYPHKGQWRGAVMFSLLFPP